MRNDQDPPASRAANASVQSQPGFYQRILVVEDECDLRQLNAEVLLDAGYHVDFAADEVTAWEELQSFRYDLLITDQFLPKLSGVDLLRRIYDARMSLRIIMATEFLPVREFALHPWLQSVTVLLKPHSFAKLLGVVENILHETADSHAAAGRRHANNHKRQSAIPARLSLFPAGPAG
jgi:DNA-binding response OmpR family regulator